MTSLISLMPDSTALNGTKCASVNSAMIRASVVLPVPGRPPEDERLQQIAFDGLAKRLAGGEDLVLTDDLIERSRPYALGERRAGRSADRIRATLAPPARRLHPRTDESFHSTPRRCASEGFSLRGL